MKFTLEEIDNLRFLCVNIQVVLSTDIDSWMKKHWRQARRRARQLPRHSCVGKTFSPKYCPTVNSLNGSKHFRWSLTRRPVQSCDATPPSSSRESFCSHMGPKSDAWSAPSTGAFTAFSKKATRLSPSDVIKVAPRCCLSRSFRCHTHL